MGNAYKDSVHRWDDNFEMDVKEICREVWPGLVWLMTGIGNEWMVPLNVAITL
jgi:hypothetical protein